MDSTNAMPEVPQAMKHWKAAWLRVQKLYKGVGASWWSLTKALNDIFDDAEFRADNGLRDDLAAAEWIDSKLPEIPLGYMELRTILKHYPKRADWENTKLSKLRDSIKPVAPESRVKPAKKRPDIKHLKRERDYYASRARFLAKELEATKQSKPVPMPPRPSEVAATARASIRNDVGRLEYHARELQSAIADVTATAAHLPDHAIHALATLYQAIEAVLAEAGQLIA